MGTLILLVDDYSDSRELYAQVLEGSGFRVAQAETGAEALEKAHALRPGAIVMDVSLPDLDGWEATRRLKADPRTRDIPVLALSGLSPAIAEAHARKVGCEVFLVKPCSARDLLEALRRALDRH